MTVRACVFFCLVLNLSSTELGYSRTGLILLRLVLPFVKARLEWPLINDLFSLTTAAAKSLQSCPTLCDPIPGILQARALEWVAISFSTRFDLFGVFSVHIYSHTYSMKTLHSSCYKLECLQSYRSPINIIDPLPLFASLLSFHAYIPCLNSAIESRKKSKHIWNYLEFLGYLELLL